MSKNQIQFISYCVNVGYKVSGNSKTYPSLDNDLDDMNERIAHLGEVLALIKTKPEVDKNNNTKKIFMIPEFFFRGKKGYYLINNIKLGEVSTNKTYPDYLVKMLQSIFLNNGLKDWIVICGTSVYGWHEENATYVYNCSLVQEGNYTDPKDAYKVAHLIQKELKSNIDFVEGKDNSFLHLERMSSFLPTEQQEKEFDGRSIFNLLSIPVKIGLEICLDHAIGRLKNRTNLEERKDIKIQLIPSAGMTIRNESIVVADDGYVFNCDGLNSNILDPKTGFEKKDTHLINPDSEFHSQLLHKKSSDYLNLPPLNTLEVKFEGNLVKAQNLFNGKYGQVYIYPPQVI
ncbi:hypothetical protein [Nostoc sp. 2RC]|uniref:hypothetical protein n=1 Tax=Nostoc sp. 2RC TaxID=2485484 RepID=UPI001626B5B5|nr:hypothetical protein [Nostoc sp. 2RC]MBC1238254.1 hypothetical protein [Nostoc sp. 2RC]